MKSRIIFTDVEGKESGAIKTAEENFNENGDPLKEINYNLEGDLVYLAEYEYGEDGKLSKRIEYQNATEISHKSSYTYDEDGELAVEGTEFADGSFMIKTVIKNKEENSVMIVVTNEKDEQEGREYRRYNEKDELVEEALYNAEDQLESKIEIVYGEDGLPSKKLETFDDGYVQTDFFRYEKEEEKVSKVWVLDEENYKVSCESYRYDDKGNVIHLIKEDFEDDAKFTFEKEFDDENRVVSSSTLNASGELISQSTYSYNDQGDIISKTDFSKPGVTVTQKFEIEYQ